MNTITGSIVALATPLHEDGSVDYPTLRKLVDWHIAEGTDCIGVVGTTGESPTVNVQEHCEIIRVSVEQAKGRVPVMAGCGANSTSEAIELARFAKKVGADCQLQVVPYYNKPTQEGQYRHFKAIAEAVELPMVLYNVPGRTVADMLHATVLRLAQVPGIVGIKEATGNIERAQWLIKDVPAGFAVYSGDDPTAVALMLCGGQGNISVTANVAPRLMHDLCVAAIAGDSRAAIWLVLLMTMGVAFAMGALMELLIVRRVEHAQALNAIVVTLGFFTFYNSLASWRYGHIPKAFPTPFAVGTFSLRNVTVSYHTVGVVAVSLGLATLLYVLSVHQGGPGNARDGGRHRGKPADGHPGRPHALPRMGALRRHGRRRGGHGRTHPEPLALLDVRAVDFRVCRCRSGRPG